MLATDFHDRCGRKKGLADGESAPAYAVARSDAEPSYALATDFYDTRGRKKVLAEDPYITVDPDTAQVALESSYILTVGAVDAASPAPSTVAGVAPVAGEEALYDYADVNAEPSIVPLRCAAPTASATSAPADERQGTVRGLADGATYELATMGSEGSHLSPSEQAAVAPAVHEREVVRRWSKGNKRAKATPVAVTDAPASVDAKVGATVVPALASISGGRWKKKKKQTKKRLSPVDSDTPRSPAGSDFEAVSIRLNDGAGDEHVNPAFSEPVTVEHQQRPSLKRHSSWKLSLKGRSRKSSFVPGQENTNRDLEAVSIRLGDELPPVEGTGEADWDDIQTFLTAVAEVAEAAESASNPMTIGTGKASPTSSTESHHSSAASTPAGTPRNFRRTYSIV